MSLNDKHSDNALQFIKSFHKSGPSVSSWRERRGLILLWGLSACHCKGRRGGPWLIFAEQDWVAVSHSILAMSPEQVLY